MSRSSFATSEPDSASILSTLVMIYKGYLLNELHLIGLTKVEDHRHPATDTRSRTRPNPS